MQQTRGLLAPVLVAVVSLVGCADAPPALGSLSPNTITSHLPAFTLHARGQSFATGSAIVLNGRVLGTARVSDEELTARVAPADLGEAWGLGEGETAILDVLVRSPEGAESSPRSLTIQGRHTFRLGRRLDADAGGMRLLNPTIAVAADDTVYVQTSLTEPVVPYLHALRGANLGQTWTSAERVFTEGQNDWVYGLGADDSGALIQLLGDRSQTPSFSRSTDGGRTWRPPIRVFPGHLSFGNVRAIATAGNRYHVFGPAGEGAAVYQSVSRDLGMTWDAPTTLPASSPMGVELVRTRDDRLVAFWLVEQWRVGHVNVVISSDLFHAVSQPGGRGWGPATRGSFNDKWPEVESHSVAIDGDDTLHLALGFRGSPNLYTTHSHDLGQTWSPGRSIATGYPDDRGHNTRQTLLIDGVGTVNLVYFIDNAIYHTRSIDGGTTWGQSVRVGTDEPRDWLSGWSVVLDREGYLHMVVETLRSGTLYSSSRSL